MSAKERTPGPWRSMPPRLAYVWLRGLVGQHEPDKNRFAIVSADLLTKCRRHLKRARPIRGVGSAAGIVWRAWSVDGNRVIGDSLLWDRAVYWYDVPKEAAPCFRFIP